MVSFDSILSDNSETSSVQGIPHVAESRVKHVTSQVIEPNETRTYTSDGSFMGHQRYFFKDGNITFLVRDVQRYSFALQIHQSDCM